LASASNRRSAFSPVRYPNSIDINIHTIIKFRL
jgi:hypothetical protein